MSKNIGDELNIQEDDKVKPDADLTKDGGDVYEGVDEDTSQRGKVKEELNKFTDEDEADLSFRSILGGDILMSRWMVKQVIFVMFIVALCLLYTSNRYSSQQDSILIDSLRIQLQNVKYNVLTQSSELMNLTRQSSVEDVLKNTSDSVLHNSILPPFLIRANEDYQKPEAHMVREVIVDDTSRDSTAVDSVEAEAEQNAEQTVSSGDANTIKKDSTNV